VREDRRSIAPLTAGLGCAVVFASLSLLTAEEVVRAEAPHPPESVPYVPQAGVIEISVGSNSATASIGPEFFRVCDTGPQLNRAGRRHPRGVSVSFADATHWTVSFDRIQPAAPPGPGLTARLQARRL
jgi:hypothetical protein